MNKKITVLVGLFLLSAMPDSTFAAPAKKSLKDSATFRNFCASYLGAVILGGSIGTVTGTAIKYLESGTREYLARKLNIDSTTVSLFLMFACWAVEAEVRNDLVTGLQGDLDQNDIEYKQVPMLHSARIAAWLSYLGA